MNMDSKEYEELIEEATRLIMLATPEQLQEAIAAALAVE